MMDELDSSSSASTTRLRRRSFFENIDSDPSAFAPPPTHSDSSSSNDKDSGSAPAASANGNDADAAGSSSDRVRSLSSASVSSTPLTGSAGANTIGGHGYRGGVAGALAQWLLACVLTLLYRAQRTLLLYWQRLRVHELPPMRLLASLRAQSAASGSVTHWAYPTQWLTLACVSLVAAQLVVFLHFQVAPLALHVKECVFHEQLMPALPTLGIALNGGPALRYLERRFEQLHSHAGPTHKHAPRLPWTCIAIVAPAADRAAALELAFLLPRSRVLEPANAASVTSRLQLVTGSDAAVAMLPMTHSSSAGVLGAQLPLSAFRHARFPRTGFPDLVLVQTEFALKQLVKLRQARLDEAPAHGENVNTPIDPNDPNDPNTAHHARARSHFGVVWTKTTVPDVYDRRVRKHWDAFLHVVVARDGDAVAPRQFTTELLALWRMHPEWPMLHVRFADSLAVCESFAAHLVSSNANDPATDPANGPLNDPADAPQLDQQPPANIDLTCDPASNTRSAIVALKNAVGMHLFPSPLAADDETLEQVVLESLAVGALVVTYNSPVMHEWVPDSVGLRVGTFELQAPRRRHRKTPLDADAPLDQIDNDVIDDADDDVGAHVFALPVVHVAAREIERAVAAVLALDRVNRVATGRAARLQYLRMRTHYLSAMAALDTAVCDDDTDDAIEVQSEIGHRSRKKVEVETLRVFLY